MLRSIILSSLLSMPVMAVDSIDISSGNRQTAVVELFTSEGCSSCPPADKWLARLAQSDGDELDVLPLSFHVDYWDYIGWKDRFASPAYTKRQRQLGANNRQRSIYTPEFFVNGKEARGSNRVLEQIRKVNQQQSALQLDLSVSKEDNRLLFALQSRGDSNVLGDLYHRYIVYENNLSSEVTRGENSGETLGHQRVVRYLSAATSLRSSNRHSVAIDPRWRAENVGVAVVVTTPGETEYLQALYSPVSALLLAE